MKYPYSLFIVIETSEILFLSFEKTLVGLKWLSFGCSLVVAIRLTDIVKISKYLVMWHHKCLKWTVKCESGRSWPMEESRTPSEIKINGPKVESASYNQTDRPYLPKVDLFQDLAFLRKVKKSMFCPNQQRRIFSVLDQKSTGKTRSKSTMVPPKYHVICLK